MMRAAYYDETGSPDVLQVGEVEDRQPGAGEVRVRVHCHGVNPTDCKRRSGARGTMPFPRLVPGFDASGVIEALGEGVDPAREGQRVWVWEGGHRKWDGTAAEFVTVPESRAMPLPEKLDFAQGAALGVPGLTAAHALLSCGVGRGTHVLVTGGAGSVGNAAVALAATLGARPLATMRGKERMDDATDAGAVRVLEADPETLADAVLDATGGDGVAAMVDVDLGAHLPVAHRLVAKNGTIASYGSGSNPQPVLDFPKYMYRNIAIRGVAVFDIPEAAKRAAAALVQRAVEAGTLPLRIDRRFALRDIAEAHRHQEEGSPRGAVIVDVAG